MKTQIIQIVNIEHVGKGLNNLTIGKTILSICRLFTAKYFLSHVSEIRELRLQRDSYEGGLAAKALPEFEAFVLHSVISHT